MVDCRLLGQESIHLHFHVAEGPFAEHLGPRRVLSDTEYLGRVGLDVAELADDLPDDADGVAHSRSNVDDLVIALHLCVGAHKPVAIRLYEPVDLYLIVMDVALPELE